MEEAEVPTELDPRLLRGLDLFDRGEHFEAHEELEELWAGEVGATRRLLQALIQITVALHHRGNGNRSGARALLERASEHLAAVPGPACFLDPRALEGSVRELLTELRGPEGSDAPATPPRFDATRAAIRAARRERGLSEI